MKKFQIKNKQTKKRLKNWDSLFCFVPSKKHLSLPYPCD